MTAHCPFILASLFLLFRSTHAGRVDVNEGSKLFDEDATHQLERPSVGARARSGEGVPQWLQHFFKNDILYVTKILGDSYTPKTLLMKGKPMIQKEETVNVTFKPNGAYQRPAETCKLLDRAGKESGDGETVVQMWKCASFPYIIVAAQRATGVPKHMWQMEMQGVAWQVPDWDGLPMYYPHLLRVRKYENYKVGKLWRQYQFRSKLAEAMNKYPGHAFFFTGASRGATLSEVMGLRFALEFRRHPNYTMPYIVSTGAYRWTNSVGRDMLGLLLPQHFAHILLGRTSADGQLEVDFVSRWPSLSSGFVDVVPQFVLPTDTLEMQTCVPVLGCPGDFSMWEAASVTSLSDNFNSLHKSINYIRSFRKLAGAGPMQNDTLDDTNGGQLPLDTLDFPSDAYNYISFIDNWAAFAQKRRLRTATQRRGTDVWQNWKQEFCDECMGVPIADLVNGSDLRIESRVGCLECDNGVPIPECPVATSTSQAGGHPGDFYTLPGGLIAKRSRALDVPRSKRSTASLVEWNFYMQTWCIHKLALQSRLQPHVLGPFALGTNPWAPRFYGLCQISESTGDSTKYTILEDVKEKFSKPSEIDIKLGQTFEPVKAEGLRDTLKQQFQTFISNDAGARLAGYRVWHPLTQKWKTGGDATLKLGVVFDRAFKYLLKHGGERTKLWLTHFRQRAEAFSKWWTEFGIAHLRCYASSLLFVWEGDTAVENPADPVLKFIDFAHCHASQDHPDWPDDGTSNGLSSVVAQLQRLAGSR